MLLNVTEEDAGMYALAILNKDFKIEEAYVKFHVYTSILGFWYMSTSAHETTVSLPRQVVEGENVLLLVHNLPEDLIAFAWFKGLTNMTRRIALYKLHNNLSAPGPVHSSRETVYSNGSLLIENVTQKDTGIYTLRTYTRRGKIASTTSMYLHVHGITVSKNIVVSQYILGSKSTVWGPAYGGRKTLYSDGSLLLHAVTQKDHGFYTLRILRADMRSEEAWVQLHVDSSVSLFCNALTSSQFMIQSVPRYAAEGKGVLLQVHNLPEDAKAFSWFKSISRTHFQKIVEYSRVNNSISWEPAFRRQGMVYENGCLMLQNVTEEDAGIYTLEVLKKDSKFENAFVEFYVKSK
ncbi:hypothetical protein ACRRTK_000842 [Alexandromys fortis]